MSIENPEELIEAGIELVEQLLEDDNVIGAGQLADTVASWIQDVNEGNAVQLGGT